MPELTLDELDTHLFECQNIIRDAVDPTDYKDYILPLVFFKTINDTYWDQYEELLEEYDGDEDIARDEAFHDFQIPEGYSWDDLLSRSENLNVFINECFDAIEEKNPDKLKGVFRADYTSAEGLSDSKLRQLIQHLDVHNLSVKRVPPDMLGEAYMDLVGHFATEEGKSGGQFFTPPHIIRLMVRLLEPFERGDKVHDPTCGSGGMLIEVAKWFRDEQEDDPTKLIFTGQEINPDIAAIARMNMYIHNLNGEIAREDSLTNPQFTDGEGQLTKYDYVLANFPFSYNWDKEALQDDPYGRFHWADKLPRADRGDYAFIMHMVEQLKTKQQGGGQCAVVCPHGVLFRSNEQKFREPMLEADIIEAVIGLPENLFQNNSIPCAVVVFNTDKPEQRKNQVLFVHADDEDFYEELSNQNELTDEGVDHIVNNFNDWSTEERVSRAVDLEEIAENDYNLNIALYVDTTEPEEPIDVGEEYEKLELLQSEREE
ncbi:MAG: N-6 DNA methylase, partial [bacterium]